MIAGDHDHRLVNNPGRVKALEAAAAVDGLVIFPRLTAQQREQGMTDFNDLAAQSPELVGAQFEKYFDRVNSIDRVGSGFDESLLRIRIITTYGECRSNSQIGRLLRKVIQLFSTNPERRSAN